METLRDKTVLITGASSGIGAETAKEFASHGAKVILIARKEEKLKAVTAQIQKGGGTAKYYVLDLRDRAALADVTAKIKKEIGIPDILFNNAGTGKFRFIEEMDDQEAIDMMSSTYFGAFFMTKAFLPEMLERNSGHIITMTSAGAIMAFPSATAYLVTRKAMLGLHEALTADLCHTSIRTSLVLFAKVHSPYWQNNPGSEDRIPNIQCLVRTLTSAEAAKVIVRGVAKGARLIAAPVMLKVILLIHSWFPFLMHFLLNETGYRRRKVKEASIR